MNDLKRYSRTKNFALHYRKGKGFDLAEKDQTKWHAPGLFDKITGEILKPVESQLPTTKISGCIWRNTGGVGRENDKIVGITPAMPSGCSHEYYDESICRIVHLMLVLQNNMQ